MPRDLSISKTANLKKLLSNTSLLCFELFGLLQSVFVNL